MPLEEGTYGICEDCGATIKLKRLKDPSLYHMLSPVSGEAGADGAGEQAQADEKG